MTPEQIRADYRAALERVGETVQIRRYTGTGSNRPWFQAAALARVVGYEPKELVGGIQQGDRRAIVLAEDLEVAQWPVPPKKGDKLIFDGKELNIEGPDDASRRVQGVLVAYELQVRG